MRREPVEVSAFQVELDPTVIGGPIMQRRKKPGERREFLEEQVARAVSDCIKDEIGEEPSLTKLLDQYQIESGIAPERAGNVMRETDKTNAAQIPQIPVLRLHPAKSCFRGAICNAAEELADQADSAVSVFVEVDMVGSAQSQHAEIGWRAVGAQLRENIVTKIPV